MAGGAGAAGVLSPLTDLTDLLGDEDSCHIICLSCLALGNQIALCGLEDPGPMADPEDAAVTCFDCIEVEENAETCPHCGARWR